MDMEPRVLFESKGKRAGLLIRVVDTGTEAVAETQYRKDAFGNSVWGDPSDVKNLRGEQGARWQEVAEQIGAAIKKEYVEHLPMDNFDGQHTVVVDEEDGVRFCIAWQPGTLYQSHKERSHIEVIEIHDGKDATMKDRWIPPWDEDDWRQAGESLATMLRKQVLRHEEESRLAAERVEETENTKKKDMYHGMRPGSVGSVHY